MRRDRVPWGPRPIQARGRGSPAAAVLAAWLTAVASLPVVEGASSPPGAVLMISELLSNPADNVSEVEGEWFELVAAAGGELAGITLTDGDGGSDFVFPPGTAGEGEILVIANGRTAPPGIPRGTTLFFANKSSWTLDDAGDDLAVVAPDGTVMDH